MDDLLQKAVELLNSDQLVNEYPSDWSIKLAQAIATISVAWELRNLNMKLGDDEFGELLAEVKRLRDAITEADKTAGDILDGVIAPSRIGGLRNKLRDAIRR